MKKHFAIKKLSTFHIIILGFLALILLGTVLLMLPVSVQSGQAADVEEALFTATSAVCVTGLVVKDTATYWSVFGQFVILVLIQIGGLGIISVTAFIASVTGRKISLLQRSMLQESISAHQLGGVVKMLRSLFKTVFIVEGIGVLALLPTFVGEFGSEGIWLSVFHSVSAFCNAGFDLMGTRSGVFSSFTAYSHQPALIIPVCFLIIIGGIGFLTWQDVGRHGWRFKKYRMQSKVILVTTALLILIPTVVFFLHDFSDRSLKERICLSLFQAVTPRTAGFNTAKLSAMSGSGQALIIGLMLVGGSPGSTAGGMKNTTLAVLLANVWAVMRRRKSVEMFGRRVEEQTLGSAASLLMIYLMMTLMTAFGISLAENMSFGSCFYETASAIGTVGLSLGITPSLGAFSRLILILLMFFGRVGGLTLLYAAAGSSKAELAQRPVEKIIVG